MIEAVTTTNSKYTIKQIFKDNWGDFYDLNKDNIRDTVIDNIARVMACGDKDKLGYGMYVCPSCGGKHYVAHTCKSRFCNSCGKVMTDNWINWAQDNMLNCPYHHIIFSPPSELWFFFRSQSRLLAFAIQSRVPRHYVLVRRKGICPGDSLRYAHIRICFGISSAYSYTAYRGRSLR